MRLELGAPGGTVIGTLPRIQAGRSRERGGVLRISIGHEVRIGSQVELEVQAGAENELILDDRAQISSSARFKLSGGAIHVGEETVIRDFAVLKSSGTLHIGARSTVSYGVVVHCAASVTFEPGVGLAEHTTVVDSDHRIDGRDLSWDEYPIRCEPVLLERNTTILAGSTVLKGTRTGQGCVAAARSVLRGSYPAKSLLAGAPAAVVRSVSGPERVD